MQMTQKYLIKLSYFGENYAGLCFQPNENVDTVEAALFNAAIQTKLITNRDSCQFSRCGRTDKGVHAAGNYIALQLRTSSTLKGVYGYATVIDMKLKLAAINKRRGSPNSPNSDGNLDYLKMLNASLPKEIRVLELKPVPDYFNARYNCIYRVYKYIFLSKGMNMTKMGEGARLFIGTHNFSNFCKKDTRRKSSQERTIISIELEHLDDFFGVATVTGVSFLWHQIRCIMAILLKIGSGQGELVEIVRLLDVENTLIKPPYKMAQANGLILYNCYFEGYHFHDFDQQFKLSSVFQESFYKSILNAAIFQCLSRSENVPKVIKSTDDFDSFHLKENIPAAEEDTKYSDIVNAVSFLREC